MNKANRRDSELAKQYVGLGMLDTAAKTLSAAIRYSLTESDRRKLRVIATELNIANHPDFIC